MCLAMVGISERIRVVMGSKNQTRRDKTANISGSAVHRPSPSEQLLDICTTICLLSLQIFTQYSIVSTLASDSSNRFLPPNTFRNSWLKVTTDLILTFYQYDQSFYLE